MIKQITYVTLMSVHISTSVLMMNHFAADEQTGNVGDGKEYEFIVSNVSGDEIHGIPVNGATDDVKGILLYDDEIEFTADEGDRIGVVWGKEEDEFKNIRLIEEGE